MKQIMFVTGRQGTGKTTLCTSHPYHVLPGQECRKHFGEKFFSEKKDASCPEESEEFVRKTICEAISKLPEGEILWVDGFPRAPRQGRWISDMISTTDGLSAHILLVTCNPDTRKKRLMARDSGNPDAVELNRVRAMQEAVPLFDMMTEIIEYNLTWSVINNDSDSKPLDVQNELATISIPMSLDDAQKWVERYVVQKGWDDETQSMSILLMKLHAEVSEAWEEYRKHGLSKLHAESFMFEMADVMVFTFAICNKMGFDLRPWFISKMRFNETRPYRHGNKKI